MENIRVGCRTSTRLNIKAPTPAGDWGGEVRSRGKEVTITCREKKLLCFGHPSICDRLTSLRDTWSNASMGIVNIIHVVKWVHPRSRGARKHP